MSNPSASSRPRDGIGFDTGHSAGARPSPLLARERDRRSGNFLGSALLKVQRSCVLLHRSPWKASKSGSEKSHGELSD
jgi:hypothetical protein